MKKLTTALLSLTLALSIASCGQAPQNDQISSGPEPLPEGSIEYYGKVASVAGNELVFDVAKLPEGSESLGDESTVDVDMGDGAVGVMALTPAVEAVPGGGGDGAANRVEVEYTGETKNFIIPAGIEVKDPSGAVKQLSDLKKGTMLSLHTDKDGNVISVTYLG